MSERADRLTKLRRAEQDARGYSTSSRWYTTLSIAIEYLGLAETATTPKERFSEAWAAVYNLFMLYGERGDEEFKRFPAWVGDVLNVPTIRHFFAESPAEIPLAEFRQKATKAAKALLKGQGAAELELWKAKPGVPDKACRWFFNIIRDIRNRCGHPDFNPSTASNKQALAAAAECLIPVAEAAIRAMIERPVDGTTGKTTAYRSFLWPYLTNSDSFLSDYYLERLFPDDELAAFPEVEVKAALKQLAKDFEPLKATLYSANLEQTLDTWLRPGIFAALGLAPTPGARIVTGENVYQPSFVVLRDDATAHLDGEYDAKHAAAELAAMIWVLPFRTSLDAVATEPELAGLTAVEVAARALAASGVPWAVLTNGQQFRLLGKATAHKPRAFLELDLRAALDQVGKPEALKAFRYWLGFFSQATFVERDGDGRTRLQRVLIGSERHGQEIGDELKQNVFTALELLGEGCLRFLRSHAAERERLRGKHAPDVPAKAFLTSDKLLAEIYQESLSLMYRLLFLFYAESRNLLPLDDEMYRETYSLEALRGEIASTADDPDPKRFFSQGSYDLWDRLRELFGFVNTGWRSVIPAYNA